MSEAHIEPLLVTKSTLARALSVSERKVDYWREHGIIPCLELGPRFVRFDLAEVRGALAQRYRLQAKGSVKTKMAAPSNPKRRGNWKPSAAGTTPCSATPQVSA